MNKYQKMLVDLYIDYANNFLTVSEFAGHYGFSTEFANELINEGRTLFNDKR